MRMEEGTLLRMGRSENILKAKNRWVVVQIPSENNIRSAEMLFLPSRQFNINFSAAEFKISGLPIPLIASGNLRSLEEQKDGDTGLYNPGWVDSSCESLGSLFSVITAKQKLF